MMGCVASLVDFEMFRPVLEDVLLTKECKADKRSHKDIEFP